jgi:exonuclease III
MRIITWNCNGAFRRKLAQIDELKADILVVQECENPAQFGGEYEIWADKYIWVGNNQNKGLGIFVKGDFFITPLDWPREGLVQFIAARINDEFNILSVWTKQANTSAFSYIGQFWKYLQLHKSKLDTASLIFGDFNSNKIWDKRGRVWNHSECVRELEEIGFSSLYHLSANEAQGQESSPTFYLHRNPSKPYHIDYAFAHRDRIPKAWSELTIGDPLHWLQYSDHMPLIVNL